MMSVTVTVETGSGATGALVITGPAGAPDRMVVVVTGTITVTVSGRVVERTEVYTPLGQFEQEAVMVISLVTNEVTVEVLCPIGAAETTSVKVSLSVTVMT